MSSEPADTDSHSSTSEGNQPAPKTLCAWALAKLLHADGTALDRGPQAFAEELLRSVLEKCKEDLPLHWSVFQLLARLSEKDREKLIKGIPRMKGDLGTVIEALPKILGVPHWDKALQYGNLDSYSQDGEDIVLREYFQRRAKGFYVDVGAHHPYRFSNTAALHSLGWKGINIDPMPGTSALFDRERPSDITLEYGVSDTEGTIKYFIFHENALNTFDANRAATLERETHYRIAETQEVPIHRLDSLLAKHLPAGTSIDLLSIDVEGFEMPVLKSNDWKRFRPKVVLLEILNAEFSGLEEWPTAVFIQEQGYRPFAKTVRTFFFEDKGA